jgi:ligand-binding sensor domain-containing protein
MKIIMKTIFINSLIVSFLSILLVSCSQKENAYPYHLILRNWVYNIKQHNDSIYFSTSEDGIFQFHPAHPEALRRVARVGRLPFRSMVFRENGTLFASSYYSGVYRAEKDTLLPVLWAQYPAWSMKQDAKGSLWLAGTMGVRFERNDSMILFKALYDAHDIAFLGNEVVVAHMQGVSVFNRDNGTCTAEYCKGVVCWAVNGYDSLLIVGGLGRCAVITKSGCRNIMLEPKDNMVWSIEKNPRDTLFLGTQRGLFRVAPGSSSAERIGFSGQTVKSLFIDKNGRLWAGRFYK